MRGKQNSFHLVGVSRDVDSLLWTSAAFLNYFYVFWWKDMAIKNGKQRIKTNRADPSTAS